MLSKILLTTITIFITLSSHATLFYVQEGTTGKGESWEDASGDLAAVLFAANYGDEIWVAAGTYYASFDHDRTRSFIISKGVKVFGGFLGRETTIKQRNPYENTVILSGNIGDRNSNKDNSHTVVLIGSSDENTVLDGFHIVDGTANSAGATAAPSRSGAGLYIMGKGKGGYARPVIRNCTFENNYGRDGGAVYCNGKGGDASPTFENCVFSNNKADLDGGALFNDGRHGGKSSPIFKNCQFIANKGNYGGAMCNYGGKGIANPLLEKCTFQRNEAYQRGGGLFNMDIEGEARPVLSNCNFKENSAIAGTDSHTFSQS